MGDATIRLADLRSTHSSASAQDELSNALGVFDLSSPYATQRIGEILVSMGALRRSELTHALFRQANDPGPPLGLRLVEDGIVTADEVDAGLALQQGVWRADLTPDHIDLELLDRLGADFCLRHRLVPLRSTGAQAIVSTARPGSFPEIMPWVEARLGPVQMAISDETNLQESLLAVRADWLIARAEARPAPIFSVRNWSRWRLAIVPLILFALLAAAVVLHPWLQSSGSWCSYPQCSSPWPDFALPP